ncbi:type II toxin-antitoxin system VapB family antitoxin [soil metagenome]
MPLNIKSAETDRIVRELAELTGESITETVTRAVAERLHRERAARASATPRSEVMRIRERYLELPLFDDRSAEEIIGYDEHGLPGD